MLEGLHVPGSSIKLSGLSCPALGTFCPPLAELCFFGFSSCVPSPALARSAGDARAPVGRGSVLVQGFTLLGCRMGQEETPILLPVKLYPEIFSGQADFRVFLNQNGVTESAAGKHFPKLNPTVDGKPGR